MAYTGRMADTGGNVTDIARDAVPVLDGDGAAGGVLPEHGGPAGRPVSASEIERFEALHGRPAPGERSMRAFLWGALQTPRASDADYDAFVRDVESAREWLNGEPRNLWED